jgi:hypothetical protein
MAKEIKETTIVTGNLFQKLAKARQKMERLERSGENTHLKYNYSTLEDIYSVCMMPLLEEGLIALHEQIYKDGQTFLITKIMDCDSKEFIFAESIVNTQMNVQEIGKQLTYFKRYHLSGLLSIRADRDDDDGESIKDKAIEPQYITDSQYNFLMQLIDNKPNRDEIIGYLQNKYKISDLKKLPKKDAAQIIDIQKNGGKK